MPSPFPGMNPYLEQDDVWEDFHASLIPTLRELLERGIPADYIVKIETRLYIHELGDEERHFLGRADVAVATQTAQRATTAARALKAPLYLRLPDVDIHREHFLEIRDRRDRRLVTVIEVLSPTNKTPGPDRDQYLAKRREILGSRTHLVEIDLRRGGVRPSLQGLPDCDYYVLVSRYLDRPDVAVWPQSLRDPLPTIPVPLSEPSELVSLDLQQALHQAYDAANYGKYIYADRPQPPLRPSDAAWAEQIAAKASK
jgi:hypothetical protein